MHAWRRRAALALGLTAIMVVATLALAGPAAGPAAPSAGTVTSAASTSAATSVAASSAAASASNPAGTAAQHALAASAAAGVSPRDVFVPRASASAAQVAQTKAQGYVSPLYTGVPAPVGLAYYGLSAGKNGAITPTVVGTTSLRGQVDTSAVGIQPQDLFQSSPDSYGIQLNAVDTGVTLFGNDSYSFWTQNVVEYYASSDFLVLVTNVWNFSSSTASMTQNAIYAHGPYGTDIYGELGYYYAEAEIAAPISYPFDLTLWMNSSIVDGRDAVLFSVAVSSASGSFAAPYDYVIFNSTAAHGAPLRTPSEYVANGLTYNPIGLTSDYELIFGGPGGGSQADIGAADATLGLAYWTDGGYRAVPAAYSYGGETGETVTGVNVAWNSGFGGPSGVADYGVLTNGPTILRGLWNAAGPVGATPVTLGVSPGNAWYVITPVANSAALENFLVTEPVAVPAVYGETFSLTPGTYDVTVGLTDYAPVSYVLNVGSAPVRTNVVLHPDLRAGVYTPLWAFSNAQLAALSIGGSGTSLSPYVIEYDQRAPLSAVYGLYNDYAFPVFPGIFFEGTTATVYVEHGGSLAATTNTFQFPGTYLPATNDLQSWFWDVTHVALVGGTYSGWFGSETYYPAVWDTFNVIFYESSHNLVASNDFPTQGQALLLFSGGTIFGAVNVGGGNNTVWGNTFTEAAVPSTPLAVAPIWDSALDVGLGIEVAEQDDLIYNNWVATPTTAWMLPINLYSGDPFLYTDTWNLPEQSAFNAHYAAGFPYVALVGSITGGRVQGGNYWWDYGVTNNPYNGADNPLGVLPYVENAITWIVYVYGPSYYYATFLYNGGDYAPLTL